MVTHLVALDIALPLRARQHEKVLRAVSSMGAVEKSRPATGMRFSKESTLAAAALIYRAKATKRPNVRQKYSRRFSPFRELRSTASFARVCVDAGGSWTKKNNNNFTITETGIASEVQRGSASENMAGLK